MFISEQTEKARKEHQAILARDVIDMIRDYADNADVLEYLEGIATSINFMMKKEITLLIGSTLPACAVTTKPKNHLQHRKYP